MVGRPQAATISWIRPGDMPAVASATVGPRPVGEGCWAAGASSSRAVRTSRRRSSVPQTRACSRRVASACGNAAVTAGSRSSPAIRPISSSYVAGSDATASASAVCRANRSRRSRARTTEARVPARVASCVRSVGTGVMRSGRMRRRVDREVSSLVRRASASERGGVPAGAGSGSRCSSVLIRSTVVVPRPRRPYPTRPIPWAAPRTPPRGCASWTPASPEGLVLKRRTGWICGPVLDRSGRGHVSQPVRRLRTRPSRPMRGSGGGSPREPGPTRYRRGHGVFNARAPEGTSWGLRATSSYSTI